MIAVIIILVILISTLVILGGGRITLAYAESRRARALGERAVTEMILRVALEDQLAEERQKRVQLEKELTELQNYHEIPDNER